MSEPAIEFLDLDVLLGELDGLLGAASRGMLGDVPPFSALEPTRRGVRDVALAGDGEPTIVRNLGTVVDRVLHVMAKHALGGVPLRLLTNATRLDRPQVARAVDRIVEAGGEIWAKLDAGTDSFYRRVNRCAVPFALVLNNLAVTARRVPLVIQSMFLRWRGEEPPEPEIEAYADRLVEMVAGGGRIDRIQIYTIARRPAEDGAEPLERDRLEAIAWRLRDRLSVVVEVFPAP